MALHSRVHVKLAHTQLDHESNERVARIAENQRLILKRTEFDSHCAAYIFGSETAWIIGRAIGPCQLANVLTDRLIDRIRGLPVLRRLNLESVRDRRARAKAFALTLFARFTGD
jgi:hypothetical protein